MQNQGQGEGQNQGEGQGEGQGQGQGQNQDKPPVYQWRITFYEDGEETIEEVFTGYFCAAWAISFPHPDEDGYDWHIVKRLDLEARFAAGQNNIVASWDIENELLTYTRIERLLN